MIKKVRGIHEKLIKSGKSQRKIKCFANFLENVDFARFISIFCHRTTFTGLPLFREKSWKFKVREKSGKFRIILYFKVREIGNFVESRKFKKSKGN